MPKIVTLPVKFTKNTGAEIEDVDANTNGKARRYSNTGRFQRGKSGNPAGRPRGSANSTHLSLRNLLSEHAEAVALRVVDAALAGDMMAARIVLDRALPRHVCRPSMGLELPALKTAADASESLARIVGATAQGLISTAESLEMARVVEAFSRTLLVTELASTIDRLEAQLKEACR